MLSPTVPLVVEARQLSKAYQSAPTQTPTAPKAAQPTWRVLDKVTLNLAAQEFVVIVGPSGSGKSTLLNIIGAMDLPDEGKVLIDGTDICALNDEQRAQFRRRELGFIFQSYNLIPSLSVRENLQLPIQLAGVKHAPSIDNYLAAIGLSGKAENWPDELSGGEQQRVAIIRALTHRPRLVIADEPTGNLDKENAIKVRDILLAQVKEHQTALLLATHDLSICDYADRVLQIDSGTLKQL